LSLDDALNVLYELGLARALHKPVVLISSNEADVPFDVRRTSDLLRVDRPVLGRESNHSYDEDPEQHMSVFLDALKAFEKLFRHSKGLVRKIRHTRKHVREWISQREGPDHDSRMPRDISRPGTTLPDTSTERSIFDDVDV
jgi:hypothetical protein